MIEDIEQGTLASNIRACIALTSWKKRINIVGLTIYNLFETCGPDYHIVLTLAEEEFPRKEQELPRDLVLMNRAGVFEILWVKKNYKAAKKCLFTLSKYRLLPVISVDDDCIYPMNFADLLYDIWVDNKECCVSNAVYRKYGYVWTNGQCTLYRPYCFFEYGLKNINLVFKYGSNDDAFISALYKKLGIMCIAKYIPLVSHTNLHALSPDRQGSGYDAKKDITNFYRDIKI